MMSETDIPYIYYFEEAAMELYQKMYAIVCAAASEAIDQIERERAPETAAHLLRAALLEAEELYISADEAPDD